MGRRALIAGASGLTGSQLLRILLESSAPPAGASSGALEQVTALVRRPLGVAHPALREVAIDFKDAPALAQALAEARPDDVYCCLGTTIKKAGSQAAFRAVDLEAPLALARGALAASAQQFILCSAVGADAHSGIFYNRVKGELEDGLRALAFPRGIKIAHPSMLLGERGERRPLEQLVARAMKLGASAFVGPLWRYRPIAAAQVARAMRNAALREPPGDRVYEGKALFQLAEAA